MALELKITIDELLIRINTNIPNKSLSKIDFTRNLLHYPENIRRPQGILNSLPYFTNDIRYSYSTLASKLKDYAERVEFFFNKETFATKLRDAFNDQMNEIDNENVEATEQRIKENSEKNVLTTIRLLFPTTFPVVNNIHQSYNLITNNPSSIPFTSIFELFDPFSSAGLYELTKYSYLNLNGQIYTFKKLTWLNDLLNNPVYKDIFIQYARIIPRINLARNKIKQENINLMSEIRTLATTIYDATDETTGSLVDLYNGSPPPVQIVEYINTISTSINIENIIDHTTNYTINDGSWDNIIQQLTDEFDLLTSQPVTEDTSDNNGSSSYTPSSNTTTSDGESSSSSISPIIQTDIIPKIINILDSIKDKAKKIQEKASDEKKFTDIFNQKNSNTDAYPSEFKNELRNFFGVTLRQYKRPIRISSNPELQTLLNQEDDTNFKKFFELLDNIYHSINTNHFNEDIQNLLNIGISTITPGTLNQQKKEIHISCEFIGGEVTQNNIGDIYCPFTNDLLANKTIDFIEKNNLNSSFWQVKTNAPLYLIDSKDSESASGGPSIFTSTTSTSNRTEAPNDSFGELLNPTKSILKKQDNSAKQNFQSKIILENDKELLPLIEGINKYMPNIQLDIDTVFDYIQQKDVSSFEKTNNDNSKSLLDLITKWNASETQNINLITEFNTKINTYTNKIQNSDILLKNQTIIDDEHARKNEYIKNIYLLYIKILKLLIVDENKKININTGGNKRTKHKNLNKVSVKKVKFNLKINKSRKIKK